MPRIPCRKLYIDSRFALPGGTSTEFEVEIPQGGLDLPDNCVGFVDSISVPSFPNIFLGKHRIYYRQERGNQIELLSEELSEKQYTLAGLVFALNNTLTFPGLTNSITVSPHTSAGTITLTMTGADSEEVRILTDDELRQLQVEPNCDVSGSDWVYLVLNYDEFYLNPGGVGVTVTSDPSEPNWHYWRFATETGPVKENNRF